MTDAVFAAVNFNAQIAATNFPRSFNALFVRESSPFMNAPRKVESCEPRR